MNNGGRKGHISWVITVGSTSAHDRPDIIQHGVHDRNSLRFNRLTVTHSGRNRLYGPQGSK